MRACMRQPIIMHACVLTHDAGDGRPVACLLDLALQVRPPLGRVLDGMAEKAEEGEAEREPDAAPEPVRGVAEADGGIDAEGPS